MVDHEAKLIAIALLRKGVIVPAEAARFAGVSQQLVRAWMLAEGINWRQRRIKYIVRWWELEKNRPAQKPTKEFLHARARRLTKGNPITKIAMGKRSCPW